MKRQTKDMELRLMIQLQVLVASLESINANIERFPDAFGGSTHSIVRMIRNDVAITKEILAHADAK